MKLLHWLLFGMLPAVAAVLVFVGVGGPRLCALGLATAVCVPFGLLVGWPPWPWELSLQDGDSMQWFCWCIAGAGLVGTAQDLRLLPRWLALPCDAALVVLLPWLLSAPQRVHWSFEDGVVRLGIAWTCVAVTWWVLRRTAETRPGFAVPLVGAVCFAGDLVMLLDSGHEMSWKLAGVAVVALGAAVVTSTWRSPFVLGPGATLAITVVHTSLVLLDYVYGSLRREPLLLMLLAPVPMWVATHRSFDGNRRWGVAVGIGLCAAMVFAAWEIVRG